MLEITNIVLRYVDELETLSGAHKKVNINENSILGKVFGYFFDN